MKKQDFTNDYVDAVEKLIDLDAIRKAGLKVIVDPMYGVGQLTLGTVLTEARCRVTFIHERHNPLFGGRSPAPNLEALRLLSSQMQEDGYDVGLAMDGDADRIAIVDEKGEYISINDILLLLYWYMHEVRGEKGGVVRNLATTHLLDRMAKALGEECYETPVGFKHIVSGMLDHNALLGGESSGGLTIRGHILGKDGIFASALVVEMLARTGQKISELLERVYAITARLYTLEEGIAATPEMRIAVPKRLKGGAEHAHRTIQSGRHLAHRWDQAAARERQLGAVAIFGHGAAAAIVGRSGYAGEGERTDRVAAAVRHGVKNRFAFCEKQTQGPSTRGRRSVKHGSKNQQRPLARNDRPEG